MNRTTAMRENKKRLYMLGALFIIVLLYFIFSISGKLYTFTDNITVAVVTGGMYGDNNMCQYLHPLFCMIIKVLNPILPTADVFALLMHVALLLGLFLVSYMTIENTFWKPIKEWGIEDYIFFAVLLCTITYFVLGFKLFGVNYTVQSAGILAMGLITLFYARYRGKGKWWIAAGTILVFFGFLGRMEACLLFLPYIALELFTEFVRHRDRLARTKEGIRYFLPMLIVIIGLLGSKALFLSIEPYKSDAAYNNYRTIAEDYPMETYGVSYKDFSKVDHSTYLMVTHWMLADTDLIDTDALERVATVGSRNEFQATKQGIKGTFQDMKWMATKQDIHLIILIFLSIVLTIWGLIAVRSIWLKLEALFSFGGGFIILFYFVFRGRAPIRVWQCTLIACLTNLALIMIKNRIDRKERAQTIERGDMAKQQSVPIFSVVFQLFLCIVLYFGVGQVLAHSSVHAPISPLTARIGQDDSGYEVTFEDDALYIWPGWYTAIPDYFSKQDKLPTQRVIEHNIAIGDWVYGQVYFRDFLSRIGAENPALALLDRPNTYLVEGKHDIFLQYMQEHYGESIQLEYSHEVNGKKAYRLVRHSADNQLPNNTED